MPLEVSVRQVALGRTPCRTRLPFKFGSATVTAADLLTCRVTCVDRGVAVEGWSADLLVPRWFRKDNAATPAQDALELVDAAVAAAVGCTSRASTPRTAFALWREVFDERVGSQPVDAPDLLVRGFGCALLERAVLDATCRASRMPFAAALRADVFGFRPGDVLGELAGWDWQRALPEPRPRLAVRHTIGMLDRLHTDELLPEHRIDDGLPQTLEQILDVYGLRWFKVKVGGGHGKDRARLLDLAAVFDERGLSPGITLDGNEQFADLAALADLLEDVAAKPRGRELLRRVAWIEQPLPRAATFSATHHRDLVRVLAFAPLMLDEADALPGSFRDALELGYRGVSVKNCKGVFRALCNFGLCQQGAGRFQSGEDLTNIGVLPLQQDLVTAAVLGLSHVERNGHHYFRGLDHLPPHLAAQARQAHPDLYRPLGSGAALRLAGGEVEFGSALAAVGYGHALDGHAAGLQVVASA